MYTDLKKWRSEIIKLKKTDKKSKNSFQKQKASVYRLIKQIKKEFKLLWTDKFNILLALVLPPLIILLIAFTTSATSQVHPVDCIIVSDDSVAVLNPNDLTESFQDNYTLPYIQAVNESIYLNPIEPESLFYNVSKDIYAMELARQYLKEAKIAIIIVIPNDFSEFLTLGLPGMLNCIVDASQLLVIQDNLNALQDSIKIFTRNNNLTPQFQLYDLEALSIPSNFNSNFNFTVTFILPLFSFGLAMVLTILVVVKEKPIARLLLTPVQRPEILLSKYITYSAILTLQTLLIIGTSLTQGLYSAGSLIDLFIAMFTLGFTGIGFGLFISCFSKTKTEANQYFFMFFIVIIMLSGLFIPIESMPLYLQIFAWILPLSHANPMINGILTKGNSVLGFHFYFLVGIAVFLFILSFIIFQRKQYEA